MTTHHNVADVSTTVDPQLSCTCDHMFVTSDTVILRPDMIKCSSLRHPVGVISTLHSRVQFTRYIF